MKIRLLQRESTSRTSAWKVVSPDVQQCGNVRIVRCNGLNRDEWRIEVKKRSGQWVEQMPKCRPWGYSGPGAAKCGVALMAAWQRGVEFR